MGKRKKQAEVAAVTGPEEAAFLAALEKNPKDANARAAYADWLDEHDQHYEAILQRGAAGLSEVSFKIRRKSDGLFSEGAEGRHRGKKPWTTKGKLWPKLLFLRLHLNEQARDHFRRQRWQSINPPEDFLYQGDTPVDDLEVVVVELRFTVGATMPISLPDEETKKPKPSFTITEPGTPKKKAGRK